MEANEADDTPPTLSELFVAMEGPLLAYATNLMKDRYDAQDLVQEAFVRLHKHFDEVRQPKAWLYRTVRNLAFNHKRKHGRMITFDPSGQEEGYSREPTDEDVLPALRGGNVPGSPAARPSPSAASQMSRGLLSPQWKMKGGS